MPLTSILGFARVYDLAQTLFGARRLRVWFVREVLRAEAHHALFEAGCGTGSLLDDIPAIKSYYGFDISEAYIRSASRLFPNHRFECTTAEKLRVADSIPSDIMFCVGLLHHLDESQVRAVLDLSLKHLKPGGRFVALEPCYLRHQTKLSRWLISQDRGRFVRDASRYRQLFAERFERVSDDVVTGLTRIPYVHWVVEASQPRHPTTTETHEDSSRCHPVTFS